jgi:uncharacterized protein (TIGR00369 family)
MDIPQNEVFDRIGLLRLLGIRIVERTDEVVIVEMPVSEELLNLQRTVHGGALATLVDNAGGMAAGMLAGARASTVDLHIRYLAPATGSVVRAEARVLRAGRRLVVTEVRVTDDTGAFVATATVSLAPFPVTEG